MSTENIIGNQQPIALPLKDISLCFLYRCTVVYTHSLLYVKNTLKCLFNHLCVMSTSETLEHVHNMLCSKLP